MTTLPTRILICEGLRINIRYAPGLEDPGSDAAERLARATAESAKKFEGFACLKCLNVTQDIKAIQYDVMIYSDVAQVYIRSACPKCGDKKVELKDTIMRREQV